MKITDLNIKSLGTITGSFWKTKNSKRKNHHCSIKGRIGKHTSEYLVFGASKAAILSFTRIIGVLSTLN